MSTPIPSRNPYFGDLHVHTAWSLDAYVMAALNGPDEAFRFAKGEPTHSSLMNTEESRLQRPLDFSAVTDHAEWLGEFGLIIDESYNPEDPEARKRLATYRQARVIRDDGRAGDFNPVIETIFSGMIDPDPKRLNFGASETEVLDAGKTIWRRIVEIANNHDDPGRFSPEAEPGLAQRDQSAGGRHRSQAEVPQLATPCRQPSGSAGGVVGRLSFPMSHLIR